MTLIRRGLLAFALALVLGVGWAGGASMSAATAAEISGDGATPNTRTDRGTISDTWRSIREGGSGIVTIPDQSAARLIQSQGDDWRNDREPVTLYGGIALALVLAAILVFFGLRGQIKIDGGRSGELVPRFSLAQRITHWTIAALFVILGLSGLFMLFGKYLLIPVIGPTAFSYVARASLQAHNLFGPAFVPALIALFIFFVRENGFRGYDLAWVMSGGGLFGKHASSGKFNGGEKAWFWWSILFGAALGATGIMLDFVLGDRQTMQLMNIIHMISAIAFIGFGLGHVYLGLVGTEGALEGMKSGTVDANWAKMHHDLWYEEQKAAVGRKSPAE